MPNKLHLRKLLKLQLKGEQKATTYTGHVNFVSFSLF